VKLRVSFVSVLLAASAASGQGPETMQSGVSSRPCFDPNEVVRQVRTRRSATREPDFPIHGIDEGEFLVDTSVTHVPAPGTQTAPGIAFDGTNFLVVWEDHRNVGADIYGARVTTAGVVLDPVGFAISTAAGDQEPPAVAFDGTNFLVVWEDWRTDTADVYGARVSPQGVVLDSNGIAVSAASGRQEEPAIAFDGTNFLVVWQDDRGSSVDIYGARVNQAGEVLDPSGTPVSTGANDQLCPAVAFDGTNFLVAWEDLRGAASDIYGARVTQAGVVLDPSGFAISMAANRQWSSDVAFDGTNLLAVWQDLRAGGGYSHIYGARVTQAGTVLDTNGISISPTAYDQWSPEAAFDGTNFLVVWEDWRGSSYYDIYGARVTRSGVVLEPNSIVISQAADAEYVPAVAFDGTNFLVAWQDHRGRSPDIYGARVTQAGVVLDPSGIPVATLANDQLSPAVGFDGTNFLVVWEDWRNGWDLDVYGARVTQAGVVLDPLGIAISQASRDQARPGVAFDGTNFLVVWEDHRSVEYSHIYGARVTRDGEVLDTSGIALAASEHDRQSPEAAFDGTNFLVVWSDNRNGFDWDIYGARVSRSGTVVDPQGIGISVAANHQWFVDLGFDGENYLVAWTDVRSSLYDIYGARVSPQGAVLESLGFAISIAASAQRYPSVAFGGTSYLVVWEDWRGGGPDIYGARVALAGVVLDTNGIVISQAAGGQNWPALGYDLANFVVAWEDCRSGTSDVYGARVTPGGVVFDSGPVIRQEGNQWDPALVCASRGDMLVVYQGWAGDVGGKTYNTDRIWGKLLPSVGIDTDVRRPSPDKQRHATIVRSALCLVRTESAVLLDISGRKVMELQPGENDIRHVATGVYFLRDEGPRGPGSQGSSVRKVVVQK
jgi:hypothetical protein